MSKEEERKHVRKFLKEYQKLVEKHKLWMTYETDDFVHEVNSVSSRHRTWGLDGLEGK